MWTEQSVGNYTNQSTADDEGGEAGRWFSGCTETHFDAETEEQYVKIRTWLINTGETDEDRIDVRRGRDYIVG